MAQALLRPEPVDALPDPTGTMPELPTPVSTTPGIRDGTAGPGHPAAPGRPQPRRAAIAEPFHRRTASREARTAAAA